MSDSDCPSFEGSRLNELNDDSNSKCNNSQYDLSVNLASIKERILSDKILRNGSLTEVEDETVKQLMDYGDLVEGEMKDNTGNFSTNMNPVSNIFLADFAEESNKAEGISTHTEDCNGSELPMEMPTFESSVRNSLPSQMAEKSERKWYHSFDRIGHSDTHSDSMNSIVSYDPQKAEIDVEFVDHFSLGVPSGKVRFRNRRVRIYGEGEEQFIIEDRVVKPNEVLSPKESDLYPEGKIKARDNSYQKPKHVITVRKLSNASFSLRMFRVAYTLVAALVYGFLWVFSFQAISYLFLNIVGQQGNANFEIQFAGALMSIPVFLYGLASIMAVGGSFVIDTWQGSPFFRRVVSVSTVAMEWMCFMIFLGIPGLTIVSTLFANNDDWWQVTAGVWVACVFFWMLVFGVAVVVREVATCFTLVLWNSELLKEEAQLMNAPILARPIKIAKFAILLSQTQFYSGVREEQYLVQGYDEPPRGGYSMSSDHTPEKTNRGIYTRFTEIACSLRLFKKLDKPRRQYTVEEVRDVMPFLTAQNWSLERMSFQNKRAQNIVVVKGGPSALRPGQVQSSLLYGIVTTMLLTLAMASLLCWFTFGTGLIILLVLLFFWNQLQNVLAVVKTYLMYRTMNKPRDSADEELGENHQNDSTDVAFFQLWERVRITEPAPWFCLIMFGFELMVLFLFPLLSLFIAGNYRVGSVFVVLGVTSWLRMYFNASSVLTELGSLSNLTVLPPEKDKGKSGSDKKQDRFICIGGSRIGKSTEERLVKRKAGISQVMGSVSRNRHVHRWMFILGVWMFAVAYLLVLAYTSDDFDYKVKGVYFVSDFYYPSQPTLAYPTCQLGKGFSLPGSDATALSDYSFLSTMGYAGPSEAKPLLDQWFGPGQINDEYELVSQYRQERNTTSAPVSYKLFSFPNSPGYGIVSIRGSESLWDWVVNVDLWSGAGLAQIVRSIMPLGWMWDPILDNLVHVVNKLESDNLKKLAYYTHTTKFVEALQGGYGNGKFTTVRVTGVSMGGGIAIITGSQSGAATVAFSGPNAMLSRHNFDPPLTPEQINTRTFNVIPDRDIIARLDDHGKLYQRIQCRAEQNSLLGCHSMWRTLCEIQYQCGTNGRPIMCWCVSKYGYPEPIQNGTRTFAQACEGYL